MSCEVQIGKLAITNCLSQALTSTLECIGVLHFPGRRKNNQIKS